MSKAHEKLALQMFVALCCLVPISAGASGVVFGPAFVTAPSTDITDLDSHFRYLSGLLLGIGVAYACSVPRIETHKPRFALLGAIVVLGGFGRLTALIVNGAPSWPMVGAVAMELLVTPAITLWQFHVAARYRD